MTPLTKKTPIPFGKYLLLDRINIGGMAEVWRGKSFGAGGFERLVAIKRILPNIAEDEEFVSMFIDEAKISVQLTHANIAQIYDLGEIQKSLFIAMEYIAGKDMRAVFERCRKKGEPAPIPLTCYVVAKLCEGLDYAHRKKDGAGRDMNIVHRDVSPQNVLISYEGEVKVIDFGIAKAAGKATKTQAGILKGKFGYMSPEQIRGLPLDRRSDVFAIGICLYEMLTGERLFVGDSDFSVLEKVRKAEVPPPSKYNRRVTEPLEKIVLRALARDVDERYQFANEIADDLQRFLITSDSIFSRKDLMQYMKSTFAEEVEREKMRLQEFADIKAPDGMELGDTSAPPPSAVQRAPSPVAPTLTPAIAAPAGPFGVKTDPNPSPGPLQPISQITVPATRRGASLANLPRLTAAAPQATLDDQRPTQVNDDGRSDESSEPGTMPGSLGALARSMASRPNARLNQGEGPTFEMDRMPAAAMPTLRPVSTESEVDSTTADGRIPTIDGKPFGADSVFSSDRSQPDLLLPDSIVTAPVPPRALDARPTEPAPPRQAPPTSTLDDLEAIRRPRRARTYAIIGGLLALVLVFAGAAFLRKPATGFLLVELPASAQGKAHVNVNGKELGTPTRWPLLQSLPAGPAVILITADGYEPFTKAVEIGEGQQLTSVKAELHPVVVRSRVIVVTDPPDAEVKLDGQVVKPEGSADFYVGEISVGAESRFSVARAGYTPQTQTVTAQNPTTPVKLTVRLAPKEVTVLVTSQPSGAHIIADGLDLGTTPSRVHVPGSTQALTLAKRCYERVELKVASGEAGELHGALHRQSGCR